MGVYMFDQFSLLHAAVGVIFYFFYISLPNTLILHTIFELVENAPPVRYFIHKNIPWWPGGKPKRDSVYNVIGDTISVTVGWLVAKGVTNLANKHNLYPF